jgi:hypothetical protein
MQRHARIPVWPQRASRNIGLRWPRSPPTSAANSWTRWHRDTRCCCGPICPADTRWARCPSRPCSTWTGSRCRDEQPSDLQSAGLLIEVQSPPPGLSPGARIPLALLSADRAGLLLPNDALLYGEEGAYVYKRVAPKSPNDKIQYVPVKVTPLMPYGDGWLVKGVDDDDEIVVHGAGVLWSLEGMGAHPVDDDDD